MLKNKTIKTILIIFAIVTAIGVMSSLLGGLRTGKTTSPGSNSGNEEIDLPTVRITFETYSDWLSLEDPNDTVNCPSFALGDDPGVLSDSLFYVKSEYVDVQTDYIWILDDYGGPSISNPDAVVQIDRVNFFNRYYILYQVLDDVELSIYISI